MIKYLGFILFLGAATWILTYGVCYIKDFSQQRKNPKLKKD